MSRLKVNRLFMSDSSALKTYLKQHPETRYLDVFCCDLSCVARGKRYPVAMADKIFKSGIMLPGSTFLLAVTGDSHDPEGMGFSDGDPDEVGRPIAATLVPAPWTRQPSAQVMMTLEGLDGTPYPFEPRNVLARVLQRFSGLGLQPVVAFELEFFLLDPAHDQGRSLQPPVSPLTGQRAGATQVYSIDDIEGFSDFLTEVHDTCSAQGITTGAMSAEYAPGQFEINLQHSDDPLAAADHCVMFRRAVQCVARKHGMQATFMSKPHAEFSGSGLHLHTSLLDADGNNVLDGGGDWGTAACASETMRHAIGGLRAAMAESMALFAPNVNSYRRFVPGNFVAVAPSWGFENRSVAMRIPKSEGLSRRIEHRVAGADANPYLALAALLAGIHHGVSARVDPGPPARGNAGEHSDPDLPLDPENAFSRCRNGPILTDYLGRDYINAYCSCKLGEYRDFVGRGEEEASWYL